MLIPMLSMVIVVSQGRLVKIAEPKSLTQVTLPLPALSRSSAVGVEISLTSRNTRDNSTVFFTGVMRGHLHAWSLNTRTEHKVTKYLCSGTESQVIIETSEIEWSIDIEATYC